MKTFRFLRPTLIGVTVVLLAFFFMQGIPLARTLYRRTDLVSARVVQNGEEKLLTETQEVVRAAEVAGMLSRRFQTEESNEPDTYYVYTFEDGTTLTVGVCGEHVFYDGTWYTGAASTPDLFRRLTTARFFTEQPEA